MFCEFPLPTLATALLVPRRSIPLNEVRIRLSELWGFRTVKMSFFFFFFFVPEADERYILCIRPPSSLRLPTQSTRILELVCLPGSPLHHNYHHLVCHF